MIAKIVPPRPLKVLHRQRLFGLLDKGRSSEVIWISGPAGSGKTTLASSYLAAKDIPCLWYHLDERDSDLATFFYYMGLAAKRAAPRYKKPLPLLTGEYLLGVPAFSRRYFENLCLRLRPPFVIVLDNYHRIAHDSLLHAAIVDALSVIPDGFTVIVNSRSRPPESLAALVAYNRIHYIDWDDLKFDMDETRALIGPEGAGPALKRTAERLHRVTGGWAAGLVLLTNRMKSASASPDESGHFGPEELFDYFRTELFEKTDQETQSFLLKTSFLPSMTPQIAARLSANEKSGTILASLARNHLFTERLSVSDPRYQYHPLFRDFLQSMARQSYSAEELADIMRSAADLLEGIGQIEEAASLWRISQQWHRLVGLTLANAGPMIAQGRSRPVEEWLKALPKEILESDPWLLYWMGVCRMPFNLPEGRKYFEASLSFFRQRCNPAGVYLAWSGGVEAVFLEMAGIKTLESWLSLFDELVKKHGPPPAGVEAQVAIRIFAALPWRHDNKTFLMWKEKVLGLMDSAEDAGLRMLAGFYLCLYHIWWVGDYVTGRQTLEVIRRIARSHNDLPPLARTMQKSADAIFSLLTGDHEDCMAKVEEGLAISNESGVHIWDNILLMTGAGTCLCFRDTSRAAQYLDKMAPSVEAARLFDRFYFHHKSAWRYLVANNIPDAVAHEQKALDLAVKTGFEIAEAQAHFIMTHLMRREGRRVRAAEHVQSCRNVGQRIGSPIVEFMSLLSLATLALDDNKEKDGLSYLGEAMTLGRSKGFVFFCGWIASVMSPLCVKALEAGIETEYAADLIRRCRLVPDELPIHVENWPWAVKIYTLGRFDVIIGGKPLRFDRKVQKKPLEMLKVLVALGGQDVGEQRFIDALWPDADGDASYTTFKSTLHRLRRLLGGEEYIQLQEGRVTLNPRYCWVDSSAFEQLIKNAGGGAPVDASGSRDYHRQYSRTGSDRVSLERAVALYQGHFLGHEEDAPWAGPFRDRLRRKYAQAVRSLCGSWLAQCERGLNAAEGKVSETAVNKAAECLERAIEIDDLVEEFYHDLMLCRQKLGDKAEAVKVYKRCCDRLSAGLGVEPSEKTRLLYNKLTGSLPNS